MNIVFGGSFNPVTKAHKTIIRNLINLYRPDNFIVVPVGNIYGKSELLQFEHRINMLNIALSNLEIVISDIESNDDKFLGTYELLLKLDNSYENIHFVMGADNLINIKTWLNASKLLKEFKFIIINRNKFNVKSFINDNLNEYKDNFLIYDVDLDVSSSQIRDDIEKYKNNLDDVVYEYIIKNNLYQKER